jgi:hypothetical protein
MTSNVLPFFSGNQFEDVTAWLNHMCKVLLNQDRWVSAPHYVKISVLASFMNGSAGTWYRDLQEEANRGDQGAKRVTSSCGGFFRALSDRFGGRRGLTDDLWGWQDEDTQHHRQDEDTQHHRQDDYHDFSRQDQRHYEALARPPRPRRPDEVPGPGSYRGWMADRRPSPPTPPYQSDGRGRRGTRDNAMRDATAGRRPSSPTLPYQSDGRGRRETRDDAMRHHHLRRTSRCRSRSTSPIDDDDAPFDDYQGPPPPPPSPNRTDFSQRQRTTFAESSGCTVDHRSNFKAVTNSCSRCGRYHRGVCLAIGTRCKVCSLYNHWGAVCRTKLGNAGMIRTPRPVSNRRPN